MLKKYSIEEVRQLLQAKIVDDDLLDELRCDERVGVKKLVLQYDKRIEKEYEQLEKYVTMSVYENQLRYNGVKFVAGVDEVGRGPLAGPVVAAAVILPPDVWLFGIDDSKKLSESKRLHYYEEIKKHAVSIGIGMCSRQEIDELNIYEATKIAMERAVGQLDVAPQHLLIDAMQLPRLEMKQTAIVKGDSLSVSIAAASIVAKVTRDEYMKKLGEKHPEYGFENHMGYGTARHIDAVVTHGIIDEHRLSFEPIRSMAIIKNLKRS